MKHHNAFVTCKVNLPELLSLLTERFKSRIRLPFSMAINPEGYQLAKEITSKYVKVKYEEKDEWCIDIQAPFLGTDPLGYNRSMAGVRLDTADLQKDTQELFEEIYQFICKATDEEFSTLEYQRFKASKI